MKLTELLGYLMSQEIAARDALRLVSVKVSERRIAKESHPTGSAIRNAAFDMLIRALMEELEATIQLQVVSDILINLLDEEEIND